MPEETKLLAAMDIVATVDDPSSRPPSAVPTRATGVLGGTRSIPAFGMIVKLCASSPIGATPRVGPGS
ncbi:MAG: hypothetical protein P4L85_27360 [Paludisphaera borealis]|uniref:hypothetical protein n=1 Tax=Paludisphaera borealis TaxID=1387353 RepID=UPI0028432A31|nr:hypothetical protein [Paludisphaera borealis]MDR3623101.1 hypothetical protein [Paludisphaera borealis]